MTAQAVEATLTPDVPSSCPADALPPSAAREKPCRLLPGNDLVHVIQETFLAGFFTVLVEAGIGKRGLAHGENRC